MWKHWIDAAWTLSCCGGEEAYKSVDGVAENEGFFDTDYFMVALRTEQLFGPVTADDVNVYQELRSDDEEDAYDDGEALAAPVAPLEYESDVDSNDSFEDDSDLFEQDDDAMRRLMWCIFDQTRSGKTVLYRIVYRLI
ncbi:unnamed protein product [Phytophthora fragariaefolia]|uniref:Unnamed protein product n=1 Tax=Phytophthora fragariaefolia TaxID=1490495 RepID=A0A9W6XIF4_9STRA|nr:unnamed protein product [Phytophthora fragariaefolia]